MNKSKSGKSKKKWIISLLLIAAAAGWVAYDSVMSAQLVTLAPVTRATINQYVEEKGRTSLPHIYHMTMPLAGRVLPLSVQEGDVVTNGQLVVQLENNDWTDALKEANDMVSAMQAGLEAVKAKLGIDDAALEYTQWLWNAKNKLFKEQQTSEIEAKDAYRDYVASQGSKQMDVAVLSAFSAFTSITKLMPIYVNRQLDRTKLVSPVDGVVLTRYVWNERYMQPGEQLLDIGEMDTLEVTSDILTEQAVQIKAGDVVELYGEAIGEKPLRATVRLVEPQAFTKLSSLGVEQQRVPVRIAFDPKEYKAWQRAGKKLGLGYRVQVRVITGVRNQALVIPRTALFRSNDQQWQVYVVRNEKAVLTTVELGLMNDEQVEVVKGVQEKDQVIIAPDTSIKNGIRVKADH